MIIRGADYHPGFQQIAFVNTDTGEFQERRLQHREEAEKFYRDLAAQGMKVRVGMEPHHHVVCSRCKSVQDIEGDFIDFNRLSRQLPGGFDLTQPLIEVFGLCRRCRAKN
jgi:Fe2+ or Zn2+ uptake regulation protein